MNGPTRVHELKLENEYIEVVILPEVGAKILRVVSRETGVDLLWQNPRVQPQRFPIDSNFDNYWCGGWDDAFPTCEACSFGGEQYPNLGELRSLEWQIEKVEHVGDPMAELSVLGPISPVRVTKRVTISGRSVRVNTRIDNLGTLPISFLWGSHPAFRIFDGSRLHVPGETGIVGVSGAPELGVPGQRYSWPLLPTSSGSVDMSRMQSSDRGTFCGHYVAELRSGWYALEHPEGREGVVVTFPRETCTYLWLWLCFGGWRGHHVAVVEPWTSYPVTLSDAVLQNTHRVLAAASFFEVEVAAHLWPASQKKDEILRRITAA